MDAAEATPFEPVRAPELASLLLEQQAPFTTVSVGTESAIENAAMQSKLRWKGLRDELLSAGAPESAVQAIDPIVPDAHHRGDRLFVVSNSNGVLHVEHGAGADEPDLARWAPLPSVGQLVRWRQERVPHVVVVADRTGADIMAVRVAGPGVERTVEGDEHPITKVGAGGWSERRFQQRAENTWERNAGDVAEVVERLAGRVGGRLVIAAGDERAVALIRESLPSELAAGLRVVVGSRSPDGSADAHREEVDALVSEVAAAGVASLLERFQEERGQGDLAADGLAPVLEALSRSQVEVLLVHDDPDDARTAWFGPEAVPVSARADDLRTTGVDEPIEARLVDVLIRAALGTGAGVAIVPAGSGPADGVGALLRWSS